jgi:hypothetical protein
MANRYWVGGTAAWDGTAGTKWSDTSGGSGGFSVPTTADDVFFSNLSTGTCTISTGNTGAKSITCTGFTGTLAGTAAITVAGSITLVAAMGFTYTGTPTLTGTGTLTSAGKTFGSLTINGTGITVTLGDALSVSSGNALLLTAGTFDANNQNVSGGGFSSSNSNTRALTMGSGTWTLVGSAFWNTAVTTGLTFSGASSTINATVNTASFAGGGLTYGTVNFTSTALTTPSITGANTFNNLTFAARSATGIGTVSLSANQTINGTLTVQSGATDPTRRLFIVSNTIGTARTITSASNTIFGADFRDITAAGAGSWTDSSRTNYWGDCKGNSGITFATGQTVYWNLAGAQNWSATGWAPSSGGTPAAANFPLAQDTAVFDNTGSVTGTITINASWNIGSIDMSGRTSAMTLATGTTAPSVYGNWTNGSGTTLTGSGNIIFGGRTTQTITSASKSFTQALIINSPSGTVQQAGALTSAAFTLTNGTYLTQNNDLTCISFTYSATGTATLTLGTAAVTLAGTGTVWGFGTTTGLTFSGASSTIVLSNTSTAARVFNGGGLTYNTITIGGTTGTSTLSISGINTFNTISSTKTVAHTISFQANQTIGNWTVTGTAGNVVTVNSSAVGTQRAITYTGSGTISMDYMSIRDINFSYTLDASNPYLVYAGANSTNGGNNNGILFQPTTVKAYRLTTGTTWTVPADWNSSNNTIHMIGAGGGGANGAVSGNNRAAGGGGGGGGYTVLTNQTLSGAIPYTIGTSAANASGGSTTFNTTNIAGGGLVGTATTVPLSTGGVGGAGTYAGGTGGAGAFGTVALTGYGSGGGAGAGGPNGIGGNGGNGFANTVTANIAGGGGGGNGGGTNGTNASSATFGNGGNNFGGIGGGTTNGATGTLGGGGAGGVQTTGGNGGSGIDISNTIGGAGGKGGNASSGGSANAGIYGGGGAGGYVSQGGGAQGGAAGSQGVIFIIYTPGGAPVSNSNFFLMFG